MKTKMNSKVITKKKRKDLEKKLLFYSVACGTALAVAETAECVVVYTPDINETLNNRSYSLNLGGGANDFSIGNSLLGNKAYDMIYRIGYDNEIHQYFKAGQGNVVNKFDAGASPGAWTFDQNFGILATRQNTGTTLKGIWAGATDKYAALRFKIDTNWHYGWVRMDVADTAGNFVITIKDAAYEDVSGVPIPMGMIPEPGFNSLGALALGFVGVLAWKRRRKTEKQPA